MDPLLNWFQLAALACLMCLGIGRAVGLHARGVRVVVIDWERSLGQVLGDLLAVVCFLLWAFLVFAEVLPRRLHVIPSTLDPVILDAPLAQWAGAVAMAGGLLIYALALRTLGDSWRFGIDREAAGGLVTDGIFSRTRNPIYIGLELLAVGTFLMQGRLILLVLVFSIVGLLHSQIRREERFLAAACGDAYREYCAQAGRYWTWR